MKTLILCISVFVVGTLFGFEFSRTDSALFLSSIQKSSAEIRAVIPNDRSLNFQQSDVEELPQQAY